MPAIRGSVRKPLFLTLPLIEKSIIEQSTNSISLVPLNLEKGQLGYETGKKNEIVEYPANSIGDINGMNCEVLSLPDSFDDIRKLITINISQIKSI
ncbi:MAG: hypothetical protein ACQEWU_19585 [Bacillota bacterium]|uniref:hypothetical protein n=1 Tax=Virgibacillus TaxID=84406 RepID=UPI001D15EC67|nr:MULTISPECIES: hypothetical protein [Virgibacillus]MCC2252735.1 hypothetical protein [Virgibacillus sp. AGTR]WBX79479.1 hypothetical protein PD280_17520 [Virgibacillus salarius]